MHLCTQRVRTVDAETTGLQEAVWNTQRLNSHCEASY